MEKHSYIKTLKDLGPNLPIHTKIKNQFVKDRSFSFLEWDMKLEEDLSKLESKCKNIGVFINKMLCKLLDNFCGVDFQSLPEHEKTLMINQLEYTNVMYMYIFLRVEELGEELKVNLQCPMCKKEIKDYICDLNTLDITCKDEDHKRQHEFTLKKPIYYKHNEISKMITGFNVDITKWDTLEGMDIGKNFNNTMLKKRMFYSAITDCLDSSGVIEDFVDKKTIIDRLKKVDIERLLTLITENNAGPSMLTSIECPHCGTDSEKILEWRYEIFFGSSSL